MTKMVSVGPLLHGKSGPGRTTFVWVGPFLTNKIGPTRTGFDGQKRSGGPILLDKNGPGDQFWVGPFLP